MHSRELREHQEQQRERRDERNVVRDRMPPNVLDYLPFPITAFRKTRPVAAGIRAGF